MEVKTIHCMFFRFLRDLLEAVWNSYSFQNSCTGLQRLVSLKSTDSKLLKSVLTRRPFSVDCILGELDILNATIKVRQNHYFIHWWWSSFDSPLLPLAISNEIKAQTACKRRQKQHSPFELSLFLCLVLKFIAEWKKCVKSIAWTTEIGDVSVWNSLLLNSYLLSYLYRAEEIESSQYCRPSDRGTWLCCDPVTHEDGHQSQLKLR